MSRNYWSDSCPLENDTPECLLQTAWFYLMLYFGKRGRENQRNMVKEDIVFGKTVNDLECMYCHRVLFVPIKTSNLLIFNCLTVRFKARI